MRWSVAFLVLLAACGGSKGKLVDVGTDVAFVTEAGVAVVTNETGIVAVSLDGKRTRTLFAERMTIEDLSADYRTWVGSDSETNLFIGDVTTGTWRRVPELDGINSTAAIAPDGKRVIASRHSDFDKRGSEEDDTLFLVDTESLAVEVLPKTVSHWPTSLAWSADGNGVLARMAFEKPAQWIDLTTKTRSTPTDPPPALYDNPARRVATCKEEIVFDSFDTEIKVKTAPGTVVTVVREEGRERGFHDYLSDFGQPTLTPQCGYVLFSWERATWLADAKGTGKAGPLVDGDMLFFADPSLLDRP